jgi:hypothetical protein
MICAQPNTFGLLMCLFRVGEDLVTAISFTTFNLQ